MLGPRPDKKDNKLKRKWEEEDDGDQQDDDDAQVTEKDIQDWKQQEEKAEGEPSTAENLNGEQAAPAPAPAPAQPFRAPLELKPGDGLRLGEGDDSRRSPDEIRIIKEMLAQDVETFIKENKVDVPAARELRNETPIVQYSVLDRGNLLHCSNTSGALISRIRDAKRGVNTRRPATATASLFPQAVAVPGLNTTVEMCGDFKRGVCKRGDNCKYSHGDAIADANKIAASQPGLLSVPDIKPGVVSGSDIDRFVYESKLDAGAALAFRSESQDVQEKVVAMGPLSGSAAPGNILMGRIRAIKMGPAERASLPKPPPPPPHGQPGVCIDVAEEAIKAIQSLAKRSVGSSSLSAPMPPPPAPPPAAGKPPSGLALPPALPPGMLQQSPPTPQPSNQFNPNSIKLPGNASVGDTQLQEEAMRAILAMNGSL